MQDETKGVNARRGLTIMLTGETKGSIFLHGCPDRTGNWVGLIFNITDDMEEKHVVLSPREACAFGVALIRASEASAGEG